MDPELKPCPNPECNGPCPILARTDDAFWIDCFECGLNGPPADTMEGSFRLWNLLPRDSDSLQAEVRAVAEEMATCNRHLLYDDSEPVRRWAERLLEAVGKEKTDE